MDAAVPAHHSMYYSAEKDHRRNLADKAAQDVRSLCILLQPASFHHLHLAGSVFRLGRDLDRYTETPIHHCRIYRFRFADPSCCHLDQQHDEATRS